VEFVIIPPSRQARRPPPDPLPPGEGNSNHEVDGLSSAIAVREKIEYTPAHDPI
jgi:hypothetical protein